MKDHYIFDYNQLLDPVDNKNDEIIEVKNNNEIYVEENNYTNDWSVKTNNNNNNNDKKDEESQDLSDEEILNELRKKFKGK